MPTYFVNPNQGLGILSFLLNPVNPSPTCVARLTADLPAGVRQPIAAFAISAVRRAVA
jgi:hypothetical protein